MVDLNSTEKKGKHPSKHTSKEQAAEPVPTSDPLQEMTELLQRTQANFENYRKQNEKRVEDMREFAKRDIIVQVLPLIDNLKLALGSAQKNPQDIVKGVELIYRQFDEILKNAGVERIATEGQKFDPYYHEALLKEESDKPENTILDEFQPGYILNSKVIRHAKVKISAGKKKEIVKEKSEPAQGKTNTVLNNNFNENDKKNKSNHTKGVSSENANDKEIDSK